MTINKVKLFVDRLLNNRVAFWIISSLLLFIIFFEIRSLIHRSPEQDEFAEEVPMLEQLRWRVMGLNAELRVWNAELLGKVSEGKRQVLVVQTGRGAGLPRLLRSLAAVRGIEDTLLIISHSVYNPELNKLVRAVRFCRVLQLFYPHSLQLHPDKFPGPDPSDCSENNTDSFCQPRDAARVENKLHWWWTMHFVFEYVREEHGGVVLFLQDNDYVTPDLLYMLQYTQRAFSYHPEADVISLGRPYVANTDYGLLKIDPWRPPFERGLAFNRSVYNKIGAMADRYCSFDDDSWSYSLLNLFAGLPRGQANMVAPAAARVLAGSSHSSHSGHSGLFPPRVRSLVVVAGARAEGRLRAPPRGNGGGGDARDQLLCHDPFQATTTNSPASTNAA